MVSERLSFTLPLAQIDIILQGLGELKAKDSYPVIKEIHDQVKPQIEKAAA